MAGKKKDKKARKAEKKAAKKAKKEALKAEQKAAPKAAARVVRKAAPKAAAKKAPVKKKAARPAARPAVKARPRQERREPESLRLRSAGPELHGERPREEPRLLPRRARASRRRSAGKKTACSRASRCSPGSVTFWLGQDDWKKGRDRVKGQGFRMYCSTTQDIDKLAERIRSAGGSLLEEPKDQPWGGRACAVADPDGFTITFASEA